MVSAVKQFFKSLLPPAPSAPPIEPFSNFYYLILQYILNLGNYFGVTSMSWDASNLTTKITRSPCIYWKCVCAMTAYILHSVFLIVKAIHCSSENCSVIHLCHIVVFLSYTTYVTLSMTVTILQAHTYSHSINLILDYLEKYYGTL